MLNGESILCFAPGPWNDIWRNRHHIMSRLARQNRVLYVEPIPHLRPILRRFATGKIGLREFWRRPSQWIRDGLYVYHPYPFLPISGKDPLGTITATLRHRLLKRAIEKLGMTDPILWLYWPETRYLAGRFGEKLCVYHVIDEYSAYRGVDHNLRELRRREELELLRQADLVITVSESLHRARVPYNSHTHIIPNGVDYDAFQEVEDGARPPEEMRDLPRPILGYIGLIAARLNVPLLRRLVTSIRGCSLVLLGSIDPVGVEGQLRALLSLPQVHYLGRKPPRELPRYLACFDVCLIPYAVGEEARNLDPLKVYEYLASGKPVVAADIPSLRRFSGAIRLASTEEEFIQAVSDALSGEDDSLPAARRRLARENSWEDRVEHISHLIESRLQQASAPAGATTW